MYNPTLIIYFLYKYFRMFKLLRILWNHWLFSLLFDYKQNRIKDNVSETHS